MAAINRFYSSTKFQSRSLFENLGVKCVFISHQKNDTKDAKKLAEYFQNAGIEIYFDEYDGDLRIQHQQNNPKEVTKAILKGINNSSHMLVVVSPNTLFSSWVPFEIGYGYDKTELRVLCLKGIPIGKLPEFIRTAPIIRDIWDLNSFIERLSGKKKEILLETKMLSDYSNYYNPLSDIMDRILTDKY